MSIGNLVHIEHSDLNATLELLDSLGVTPQSFNTLRKCSSWEQQIVARVLCLDADLMQMLMMEDSAKKAGFSLSDFGHLAGDEEMMRRIRDVIRGYAEIKPIEHLIDCDADPYVPDGWKVEEHQKGGLIKFDPTKVQFFLSKQQRKGKVIEGNELRKELEGKPVLNANVLDWLLKHPALIPEEWKKDENGYHRYISFWGTIYRDSDSNRRVRYLYWDGARWCCGRGWRGFGWGVGDPAAVLAQPAL